MKKNQGRILHIKQNDFITNVSIREKSRPRIIADRRHTLLGHVLLTSRAHAGTRCTPAQCCLCTRTSSDTDL